MFLPWCRETSSDPGAWTRENLTWGQCAVTALIVQDYLGGDLLRAPVGGSMHYWNLLPNGVELDLTRGQFGPNAVIGESEIREREYVLSFPATVERYELLEKRAEG